MRKWSVLRWPVALAAMSDITPSARPPSHSRKRSGAAGSWKSIASNSTPSIGSISSRSMRDHPALAFRRLDRARRDLAPAARRGAEIDDARAGSQQLIFLGDLDQLVGGARAPALALGLRDEGIVELALQPQRRGERALARGAHARLQRPAALAPRPAGGHAQAPAARACGPTRSARIICVRMPSRRPRSAMRMRSAGKWRADRLENRATRQHEVGALDADAAVGGAFGVAHALQPRHRGVDLGARQPQAVDRAAVVARQIEMHAGDGGHRSRRCPAGGSGRIAGARRRARRRAPALRRRSASWRRKSRG